MPNFQDGFLSTDNHRMAERIAPRNPSFSPENVNGVTASIITTDLTEVIPAPGAGQSIYLSDLLVTCAHASVGTYVEILAGLTVIWKGYAAAAGGGFTQAFKYPIRIGDNVKINAKCVTDASDVIVSASGYLGIEP